MINRILARTAMATLLPILGCQAPGQNHGHAVHDPTARSPSPVADARPLISFPDELRIHTLANMRDHLLAMQEIQEALSREQYDRAGQIAEQRLGQSSLALHGAHDVAKFMPSGMQAIGSEMHRAASRFALAARDAGATGDVKPALAALARVSAQCVACHAGYRIQ